MSRINVETMEGRLLQLHANLYPERYPAEFTPDHEFHEAGTEVYEWDSGTIEWVAAEIEQILVDFDIVEAER